MASVGRSILYLARPRVFRRFAHPLSLVKDVGISTRAVSSTLFLKKFSTDVSQHVQEDREEMTRNTRMDSMEPTRSIPGMASKPVDEEIFRSKYEAVCERLRNNRLNYFDVIYLLRNAEVTQLQEIKELLEKCGQHPMFIGGKISTDVVKMCLRLNIQHEAVLFFSNPTKYNLSPIKYDTELLMRRFIFLGDVEGFEKTCEIIEGMNKRYLEFQRIKLHITVLTGKLKKNFLPEKNNHLVADEIVTQTEQCLISEDEGKEELDHILHLCHDLHSHTKGIGSGYYVVFGKLILNGHYAMAQYMFNKLVEKEDFPQHILLNMQLDYSCAISDYSQVIELLRKAKELDLEIFSKRLSKLTACFKDCQNADLKKTFQDLIAREGE